MKKLAAGRAADLPVLGPRLDQSPGGAGQDRSAARPVGSGLLTIAAGAGTGAIKFLIALIIAGFLFPPAPATGRCRSTILAPARVRTGRRLRPDRRGDDPGRGARRDRHFGAAGVSCRIGLVVAGVPGASLITLRGPHSRNYPDRPVARGHPGDHLERGSPWTRSRPCCSPPT